MYVILWPHQALGGVGNVTNMIRSVGRFAASFLLLSVFLFSSSVVFAQTSSLRPARAIYDLHLNKDRESAGILGVKGRMVAEYIEDCSGFILNQGFILRFSGSSGLDFVNDLQASHWESRDGDIIRFNLTSTIDGKSVEQEQGRAELGPGGAGNATWDKPKALHLELPKGTAFPAVFSRKVLAHAIKGSRGFETPLFDGSHEAGYYLVSIFIGDKLAPDAAGHHKLLAKTLPRWPIRMAYYSRQDQPNRGGVPEFEIGYTLYGDGVTDGLTLDYPEFGLKGRLVELEYLDQPSCE
jgi:hypothetical protein